MIYLNFVYVPYESDHLGIKTISFISFFGFSGMYESDHLGIKTL